MKSATEFFSDEATEFESGYSNRADFRDRFKLWTGLLDRYAANASSAIDMGCGPGLFSAYLARKGLAVIGIDGSAKMIELCGKHLNETLSSNLRFIQANIPPPLGTSLPKVDLIVASSVLEYIAPFHETLRLFSELLNQNGILIVSLPNADSLYRKFEALQFKVTGQPAYYSHVRNVLTVQQLNRAAEMNALSYLESHYYAHDTHISRICRRARLSARHSENLFVSVFRKREPS